MSLNRQEPRRGAVAERVQVLEDRHAVRDLIMTCGYLRDARRWDDLLDLYTDDIERILAGSLEERVQGKAALRAKLVAPTLQATHGWYWERVTGIEPAFSAWEPQSDPLNQRPFSPGVTRNG